MVDKIIHNNIFQLIALTGIILINGCIFSDGDTSIERAYVIEVDSQNIELDSIVAHQYINGLEIEPKRYYNTRYGNVESTLLLKNLSTDTEGIAGNYVYAVQFQIAANSNDTVEVIYHCYSYGFEIITSQRKFIMSQQQTTPLRFEVDKVATAFIKELRHVDSTQVSFQEVMVEKMCVSFESDALLKLYQRRDSYSASESEELYNNVMDCMFSRIININSLTGINKNLPSTLDVDSVFNERFFSGQLQFDDYSASVLKHLIPSEHSIDSAKMVREGT